MNDEELPRLFRSASQHSLDAQAAFYKALWMHLALLLLAAALSVLNIPHWTAAVFQAAVLAGALACAVYLAWVRPERDWYGGRAVAESAKTMAWRYSMKAEPFHGTEADAHNLLLRRLTALLASDSALTGKFSAFGEADQITVRMQALRAMSTSERLTAYLDRRVVDQLTWYTNKAAINKRKAKQFGVTLVVINGIAFLLALARIHWLDAPIWPTDIFVTAAASLVSWIQAKRFSDLATSYTLASHEIGFAKAKAQKVLDDVGLSNFVGDTENAFSREHTQWIARQDQA